MGEVGFEVEGLGEGQVGAEIDGSLEGFDDLGVERGEAVGESEGLFSETVRGSKARDESVVEGLFGGYGLSGEEEMEGAGGADDAREGLGASAAGMRLRRVSGIEKEASVAAMRRSHSRAISRPEPMQWPWMAATRGFWRLRKRHQRSRAFWASRAATIEGAEPNSVRSAPAQKFLPTAERRTTRTSGSSRTASRAW